MTYMDPYPGAHDLPTVIKIQTKTGQTFTLSLDSVHGLWQITTDKGILPDRLQGKYTDHTLARKAVYQYIEKQGKEVAVKEK